MKISESMITEPLSELTSQSIASRTRIESSPLVFTFESAKLPPRSIVESLPWDSVDPDVPMAQQLSGLHSYLVTYRISPHLTKQFLCALIGLIDPSAHASLPSEPVPPNPLPRARSFTFCEDTFCADDAGIHASLSNFKSPAPLLYSPRGPLSISAPTTKVCFG